MHRIMKICELLFLAFPVTISVVPAPNKSGSGKS